MISFCLYSYWEQMVKGKFVWSVTLLLGNKKIIPFVLSNNCFTSVNIYIFTSSGYPTCWLTKCAVVPRSWATLATDRFCLLPSCRTSTPYNTQCTAKLLRLFKTSTQRNENKKCTNTLTIYKLWMIYGNV